MKFVDDDDDDDDDDIGYRHIDSLIDKQMAVLTVNPRNIMCNIDGA